MRIMHICIPDFRVRVHGIGVWGMNLEGMVRVEVHSAVNCWQLICFAIYVVDFQVFISKIRFLMYNIDRLIRKQELVKEWQKIQKIL